MIENENHLISEQTTTTPIKLWLQLQRHYFYRKMYLKKKCIAHGHIEFSLFMRCILAQPQLHIFEQPRRRTPVVDPLESSLQTNRRCTTMHLAIAIPYTAGCAHTTPKQL